MIAVREFLDTGVTVFDIGFKLDYERSQELSKLIQSVSTVVTPGVVINLESTEIVDSRGIGALVSCMKHIQQRNGRFALAGTRPKIQKMFQQMNLHNVFDVFETLELATEFTNRTP